MNRQLLVAAALAVALVGGGAVAEEPLKSGPQVGEMLPGAFRPLNVTNCEKPEAAGKKNCLVCQYGQCPAILIFARDVNDPVATLVKKLDPVVAKHRNQYLSAALIVLSDKEGAEKTLKDLAARQNIKNVSLAVDNPAGPEKYKIARDAEVTVILYEAHKVKANHAFKKGQLNDQAIEKILADVPKILN
jgi:hypothetical protein